jgi:hypothetical protein
VVHLPNIDHCLQRVADRRCGHLLQGKVRAPTLRHSVSKRNDCRYGYAHRLVVVTRNVADFFGFDVAFLNTLEET